MSTEELKDYVRSRMPVRARMLGQDGLGGLVDDAIAEWPISPLMECVHDTPMERKVLGGIAERVRARRERYGFVWSLLLASALSAVIRLVLEWWLSRPANRVKLAGWQCAMRGEP
jgi:hypothetical protein